jgi:hypothetical protein
MTKWWRTALLILGPVVLGTALAVTLLLTLVDVSDPTDQIEVLKTGFTIGAGIGGVVALALAGRRQWVTERANQASEHDASERRITELYTRAVDQLGSEQAAVRLGGLYALERLGNANPTQQETIGNVICAYLRMPYTTPDPITPEDPEQRARNETLLGERETRQTALEILLRHYGQETWKEWPSLRIRLQRANLAGAALSDMNLRDVDLSHADLSSANLFAANLTDASLFGANLSGVILINATLNSARLPYANLERASLDDADLTNADLTRANLTSATLNGAHLPGTNLTGAQLTDANLVGVDLTGTVGKPSAMPDVPGRQW